MRHKNIWYQVKSIFSRIDRLIRHHKNLAIGFVATLLIVWIAKNMMYLPVICPQQPSINIIDESKGGLIPGGSLPYSQNIYLQNYVATISKHFSTKMNQLGKCHYAELFFVYRPLISPEVEPFNFEPTKSNDTRSLDSPWVKLTLTNSYKPIARAAFVWNERQFLLDQSLMSGVYADFTKPLLPIDINIFNRFVKDYKDADLIALSEFEAAQKKNNTASQEIYRVTLANNTRRLPADIFWLLRHSGIGSDPPSGSRSKMDETIKQGAEQYIELTKALINHRFKSVQTEQSYQSVLDLKDVFNIDKYRIN